MAFIDHNNRLQSSLSEINVTPLVDVMLVLLVIFMITAPMLQTGIQVTLPKTKSAESTTLAANAVLITIDKEGNIYVGTGAKATHSPINVNDLPKILEERLASFPEKKVYLRGDGDTPYRIIAYVLSVCKQHGAQVSLVTDIEQ
jgi:biopolymer transport protein ExbD/biopolymer transport protein TolR